MCLATASYGLDRAGFLSLFLETNFSRNDRRIVGGSYIQTWVFISQKRSFLFKCIQISDSKKKPEICLMSSSNAINTPLIYCSSNFITEFYQFQFFLYLIQSLDVHLRSRSYLICILELRTKFLTGSESLLKEFRKNRTWSVSVQGSPEFLLKAVSDKSPSLCFSLEYALHRLALIQLNVVLEYSAFIAH